MWYVSDDRDSGGRRVVVGVNSKERKTVNVFLETIVTS